MIQNIKESLKNYFEIVQINNVSLRTEEIILRKK